MDQEQLGSRKTDKRVWTWGLGTRGPAMGAWRKEYTSERGHFKSNSIPIVSVLLRFQNGDEISILLRILDDGHSALWCDDDEKRGKLWVGYGPGIIDVKSDIGANQLCLLDLCTVDYPVTEIMEHNSGMLG